MDIDPRRIPFEEREARIAATCAYQGIDRHKQYTEEQAAFALLPPERQQSYIKDGRQADRSTLKRARLDGKVPYVAWGNGSVRYKGEQLADYLNYGKHAVLQWGAADIASESTGLEISGSASVPAPPPGTGAGSKAAAPSAGLLAQTILKPQRRS